MEKMKKRSVLKKRATFAITAVLLFTFGLGGFTSSSRTGDKYFEISKNLDIFGKLYREVNSYYVDDVDPNQFMREGIDGMLEGLDPYTNFISASEIEEYKFMSTGQYGGIGAVISRIDGKVIISEPYEGSPALKAGLMAGDVIIQIDDEVIEGKDGGSIDVRNLLRGQPNTDVRVKVRRPGEESPQDFTVTRDEITIKNVPYYGIAEDHVGYISLTGFTKGAAKEVASALEDLKKQDPELGGVILDLRGNPGGLLFEAINISNIFVRQGEKIVETKGRMEGSQQSYYAEKNPIDTEIPLVVMVNRRSASASEIVSGVMQDLDRGVIVGQRSFGKGLVQTTRPLSYNTQLKITTAKYYTPSGRCIQAIDYSHRNEDGSVGKVADSLKTEFSTKNGRKVYDGGGIEPDVEVDLKDYHTVTQELVRQNLIFDYATKFRRENTSITTAKKFEVTDKIYQDFVSFAESKEFTFESRTEKELDKLKAMLEEESYYDDVEGTLKELKTKIDQEKKSDLNEFRDEISGLIKTEIASRYYYQRGQIEATFTEDEEIVEAIKILQDPERYKKVLAGNN